MVQTQVLDVMELLLSLGNEPKIEVVRNELKDMLEIIVKAGHKSAVLSSMSQHICKTCVNKGYSRDDVQYVLELANRLNPAYAAPQPKDEVSVNGLYVLRSRLKSATEEQREYFKKLWDVTPKEKRSDLLQRMANLDCEQTLYHILEHGPDFLNSLDDHQRYAVVDLIVDVNCNEALRKLFLYGRRHCTNGGKTLFMHLLDMYSQYLKDENSRPANVMEFIHELVVAKH